MRPFRCALSGPHRRVACQASDDSIRSFGSRPPTVATGGQEVLQSLFSVKLPKNSVELRVTQTERGHRPNFFPASVTNVTYCLFGSL